MKRTFLIFLIACTFQVNYKINANQFSQLLPAFKRFNNGYTLITSIGTITSLTAIGCTYKTIEKLIKIYKTRDSNEKINAIGDAGIYGFSALAFGGLTYEIIKILIYMSDLNNDFNKLSLLSLDLLLKS